MSASNNPFSASWCREIGRNNPPTLRENPNHKALEWLDAIRRNNPTEIDDFLMGLAEFEKEQP